MKPEEEDDFNAFVHEWPNCPVYECKNKICLALESPFCFVHTPKWLKDQAEQIALAE